MINLDCEFYVYTLSRPNGVVFYVGKGKGRRIAAHEEQARRGEKSHFTPEDLERRRQTMQGNQYALGYEHTAEARQKIAEAQLGNQRRLGHHHSPETRAKMAAAHRETWARRKVAGGTP